MKKLVLAALVVLAGLSGAAAAQSLAYGITLGNVQAVRDSTRNVSTITGFLANQSERNVNSRCSWNVFTSESSGTYSVIQRSPSRSNTSFV